jgi:ABC-type nitrate/sulfonate/bicarbonate transport system substrate-binding protein
MPQTVVLGTFTPSVLLGLARRSRRLEEQSLTVEEVPVPSSPDQFRALVDGELDAALTSPDNVLAYRFNPRNPLGRTLDARVLAAVDRGMGLGLYVRAGTGASDLRGARVAVDVPVSGFALALYALTDALGLGREDYTVVRLGSTPRRLEALLAGECDATMLGAGNELLAEAAGCTRLAAVTDVCAPYLGTVLAVLGEADEPVVRLWTALRDTMRAVAGRSLDDEAREVATRLLGLDPVAASRYVDRLRDPEHGLVLDGRVDDASLEALVRLRQRFLPEVVDGVDVLERALQSGSGLVVGPPT